MTVPSIDREHALAFRQRATHLHKRLPVERLTEAAFAGLQDSSPRSAVLALHARVENVSPSAWKGPRFVQVWGPRGAVYVVLQDDVAVFTIGFLPRDPALRAKIVTAADKAKKTFRKDESTQVYFHGLREASASGTIRIEWDGSRSRWWIVDPPAVDPENARLELVRRFLRSVGPGTPKEYAWWSGNTPRDARQTFQLLEKELAEVNLEGQSSSLLRRDLRDLQNAVSSDTIRLLPPGDPYLAIPDRKMLVPIQRFRNELWPKSVWPGALLVNGEIAGTWRRQIGRVIVHAWQKPSAKTKAMVEEEVMNMPIVSTKKDVRWIT
jgi:Winged helix DNA-binding domain